MWSSSNQFGSFNPVLDGRILADETGLRHGPFDVVLHFSVLFQPAKCAQKPDGLILSLLLLCGQIDGLRV